MVRLLFLFIGVVVAATAVARMVLEHRVGNVPVGEQLNRAVVVGELLGGDAIRVVTMHCAIDADNLFDQTRNRADVVRYHDDGHPLAQFPQGVVERLLKLVVDEVGRLVQNQELGLGDDGSAE